jgi:hypothetical protein
LEFNGLLALATICLVVATIGLVIVTWRSVRHTANMAGEMTKQQEAEFQPYLAICEIHPSQNSGGWHVTVVITNVGKGPALQVQPHLTFGSTAFKWYPVWSVDETIIGTGLSAWPRQYRGTPLPPGDDHWGFGFDGPIPEGWPDSPVEANVQFDYSDMLDREFTSRATYRINKGDPWQIERVSQESVRVTKAKASRTLMEQDTRD